MSTKLDAMQVPTGMHLVSGFIHRTRPLWIALGNLETSSVAASIEHITIDRPVYVTGLARAGTTILLEFLAQHSDVATHKYRDFPGVFTPIWWDRGYKSRTASAPPQERAHGDGLAVTPDSPEAIEEVLWMSFFPQSHDPTVDSVLTDYTEHPRFEKFYRDHLRKLLWVRNGGRYVAKGNYNLTRMQYLRRIFPNARFIVAVRNPRSHIASLVKQHRLFCEGERRYPRALAYMQRVGHYEFGLDRRPINVGQTQTACQVIDLWERGEEVRGWARYWASLYGWLAEQLRQNVQLAATVRLVRYEDLCDAPVETLSAVSAHCDLDDHELTTNFAGRIAAPRYYEPQFTEDEEAAIEDETAESVKAIESSAALCSANLLAST
jgi:hypothetical protein